MSLITDHQIRKIATSAIIGGKGKKVSITEIKRICDWAELVRVKATILELILNGKVFCSWPTGAKEPIVIAK